jgi:hypothetical protein
MLLLLSFRCFCLDDLFKRCLDNLFFIDIVLFLLNFNKNCIQVDRFPDGNEFCFQKKIIFVRVI